MRYVMRAGVLYDREQKKVFARIQRDFAGQERSILSPDGDPVLTTDVCRPEMQPEGDGEIRFPAYIMRDKEGAEYARACPYCAGDEEPEKAGGFAHRMQAACHARLTMKGRAYELVMENSRSYAMEEAGREVLRIAHLGPAGGWDLEASDAIPPEIVCGLFVFCRYMELENEFPAF